MTDTQTGWYLVLTKPHHENIAKQNLQHQGFHIYLPLHQQHKRIRNIYQLVIEPLFPRYIFVSLNSSNDDWSKIRSTRSCVSLIRFGSLLARVPDSLITQLKTDESNRFSKSQAELSPHFKPGDKVTVLDGLLRNYEGIIEAKNSRDRITLLLTIAEGHTRKINLSIHQIKKAD